MKYDTTDKFIIGIIISLVLTLIVIIALFSAGVIKEDPNTDIDCIYMYQPNGVIIPICTVYKKTNK